MGKTNRWQLLIAGLLLVGGIAGYFAAVPSRYVNIGSLNRLIISTPGFSGVPKKSTLQVATPVGEASTPSLRQGYDLDPGQTGSYSSDFLNASNDGTGVTTNVEILPTTALANLAYTEQTTDSLATSAIKAEKATITGRFDFAGISKSAAVTYKVPNAKSSITVYSGLIQIDRAVVLINIEGPTASKPHLTSIINEEATLLRRYVPTWPSMWATHYWLVPTLLWFGGMIVLIALTFAIPASARKAHAARVAREEARRRYEVRSRGAKVVRRQRVTRR